MNQEISNWIVSTFSCGTEARGFLRAHFGRNLVNSLPGQSASLRDYAHSASQWFRRNGREHDALVLVRGLGGAP